MKGNASLFDTVLGFRTYRSSSRLTNAESAFQQVARGAMFTALGLFSLILVFALGKMLFGRLPNWLTVVVLVLLALDVLAAYVMLISDALVTLLQLFWRKVRHHHDRSSYAHDHALANQIASYPEAEVRQLETWLGYQADGMERRMAMLFGRGFAVISLVGFLANGSLRKAVTDATSFIAPSFKTTPEYIVLAVVVAIAFLLIGMFGAMAQVSWYRYIRYLIELSRLRMEG